MGFNLEEIKQALKQPKSYIWDSYTSSKPSASNLVGKSDVAFDNTPQYSAASTADDFWRQSQESDSNYYESRGYTFDGTKWVSPNEQMLQRTTVRNVPVNNSWFKGNRTYWENQAKNAYSQLNSNQRGLIDKDGNGSFSLEEIRDYQRANGLVADGKLGKNTMARLNTPSGEKTYNAGQLRTVVIPPENSVSSNTSVNTPTKFAIKDKDKDWHNAMTQAGGKVVSVGDGTYAFLLNGNVYYNNGRMKGANGKMSSYDFRTVSTPTWFKGKGSYWNAHTLQQDIMKQYAKSQGIEMKSRGDLYYQLSPKQKEQLNSAISQIKNNYLDRQGVVGEKYNAFTDDRLRKKATVYQNGGQINKYQQGGTMNNEQELQKAFMAFLIEDASTQGITIQSEEDLVKYAESLGEDGIKAKYQEFMQKMQGGVKAKLGTKLNYIRKIKGLCADDEELVYMKQGGRVCPVCQKKKDGEVKKKKMNAVEAFKAQGGADKNKEKYKQDAQKYIIRYIRDFQTEMSGDPYARNRIHNNRYRDLAEDNEVTDFRSLIRELELNWKANPYLGGKPESPTLWDSPSPNSNIKFFNDFIQKYAKKLK